MQLFFTLLLVLLVAAAYFFYDKFTQKGAVPLARAWKSYTAWLAALGMVLGDYLVTLLGWAATQVDFIEERFGSLLADPSAGQALQLMSWFYLLLRLKGQGLPSIKLPDLPDEAGQAGA
jgi:hypothetical protein